MTHFALLPPLAQAVQSGPTPSGGTLESLTATEWNPPRTPLGWGLLLGVGAALLAWTIWLYVRDTRRLPRVLRAGLLALRIGVLVCLAVVALDPRERTQTTAVRPSRVAVLIDTSQSMQLPADPTGDAEQTRAEAVTDLLTQSPLLRALGSDHRVQVFRFDSSANLIAELPAVSESADESTADETARNAAFAEALQQIEPNGRETRLGEAVADALRQVRGPTLAGAIVLTDGGQNAGAGADAAVGRAARDGVPLFAVGVGGTERPANVRVTDLSAPTDVRFAPERERQDPFEVRAFFAAEGLEGEPASVTLTRAPAESDPATTPGETLETRTLALPADGETAEATFEREPTEAGRYRYTVTIAPPPGTREARTDDNARSAVVNARSRPTSVLLIAGGPNRDYRFLQTALARQATAEVDVLLQSIDPAELPGVTQDGDALLAEFPENFPLRPPGEPRPESSPDRYDVVLALDADWSRIPPEGVESLSRWVDRQRGGLVFAAGDVYTPQLTDDSLYGPVRDLLPVRLASRSLVEASDESARPWQPELTDAATSSGVLDLDPERPGDLSAWERFEGFYRAFPTRGAKDLASVLMLHGDPRTTGEGATVLIADQRYGGGRVYYLGTSEFWRLRAEGPELFERFWTNLIRAAAEGRATEGDEPALFLIDRPETPVGEPVRIAVGLRDARGEPVEAGTVRVSVDGPDGFPAPGSPLTLRPVPGRPGRFEAPFTPPRPGRFTLTIDGDDVGMAEDVTATITAVLPELELATVRQEVPTLTALAEGTDGRYLPLAEAADALPELLESRERTVTVEESVRALWDVRWMLFLIVGLFGFEWLVRKLARLA
ncbi:VWA domain-containing protein [Alienimonas sp. DA493]|uniref:VWA domain-containing protein n=1 Tax=Alienimonas sp. DA493 TaxID=3373605 RepID=UPI0037542221